MYQLSVTLDAQVPLSIWALPLHPCTDMPLQVLFQKLGQGQTRCARSVPPPAHQITITVWSPPGLTLAVRVHEAEQPLKHFVGL